MENNEKNVQELEQIKTEKQKLQEFILNKENRKKAEEQGVKLFEMLTGGKPIEYSPTHCFTEMNVVKATNLSHKKAQKLFELLRIFGILEFTGKQEFMLHFEKNICREIISTEILSMSKILYSDLVRYKSILFSDEKLSEDERKKFENDLKKQILEQLKIEE